MLWLALLLAIPAAAQRTGEVGFTVDIWGGIDTQRDSSRISDFDATSAVKPVWCEAPRPAPLSPSKYS